MNNPYRAPTQRNAATEDPRAFIYAPGGNRSFNVVQSFTALVLATFFGGGVLYLFKGTLAGLFVVLAFGYVFWRAKVASTNSGVMVMKVDSRTLELGRAGEHPKRIPLKHLYAIELEHQDKQHAQLQLQPGMGAPADKQQIFEAGTIRISRIVLALKSGETFPLSGAFYESDATAAMSGKLRIWLRAHGWVPKDERKAPTLDASTSS